MAKNNCDTAKYFNGRKKIYTGESDITAANVVDVLNDSLRVHSFNADATDYLEKYVRGIQPILARVKEVNKEICNRVVVNIANQIVAFKTATFAGEPIQYVSRGGDKAVPELVQKLNSMMLSEGKQSKDMELAHSMFTSGVGYRLVLNDKAKRYVKGDLYDEAPFEVYIPSARTTFVVRANDVTQRVVMGVTYAYQKDNSVIYTVYTENEVYTIAGGPFSAERIVSVAIHNFGMVPLIEYPSNPERMGAPEVVLPLLDAYNALLSNRMDGIEQFIQALMVFEGVDVSREQIMELKDLGAIKIPASTEGHRTSVYYLNSQLDQQQTQTLVDSIYDRIREIVGMPSQGNANTSDSSNNGAMIVKNGWWNAEARALETENAWKLAETDFLRVVLKICRDANALEGLKVSDVEPKFARKSYEDKMTKVQAFQALIAAQAPPLQAFKYSGLDTDPEAAAIAYEKYQDSIEQAMMPVSVVGGTKRGTTSHSSDDDKDWKRRFIDRDGDGIVGEL